MREVIYDKYGRPISFGNTQAFAKLMTNVYVWMAMGLAMTGLTAMYVSNSLELMNLFFGNSAAMIVLIIAELAMVMILSARIMKMQFLTAGLLFAGFSVLNGVNMASIFLVYTQESIASAFFSAAGTFGAMSLVGFVIKKDLSFMGRTLLMLLVGLIIATLVNFFVHSSLMAMVLNYLGVALFTGLTAYDTQKIKNMLAEYGSDVNDTTNKLALLGSLTLYLDFINLFLYLLRIMGSRRD